MSREFHEFEYYLSEGELHHVDCLSWAHSFRAKPIGKRTKFRSRCQQNNEEIITMA